MLKKLLNLVLPTSSYLEMENKNLSLKEKITVDAVQEIFERKGYKFFTNGKYNLNLLGVRKDTSVSNKFDDYLVAIYKSEDEEWKCLIWEATTDPGKHWLEKICPLVRNMILAAEQADPLAALQPTADFSGTESPSVSRSVLPGYSLRNKPRRCSSGTTRRTKSS